jgi:hypothetical protein
LNALSVRKVEAKNDQRQSGSESSSAVTEGYGLRGNEFSDGAHVDQCITGEKRLLIGMAIQERERHNGCSDALPASRATVINARIYE